MPKFEITVQGVTKLVEGLNRGKAPESNSEERCSRTPTFFYLH